MADELDTTTDPAAELQADLADAIGVTDADDHVIEGAPNANDPVEAAPATAPAAPSKTAAELEAEAAAAAAAADPAVKAAAELYAPLPEHNPRKTHERFAKLIEGHKELDAKVKELQPLAERAQALETKIQEHEQGWRVFQELGFASEEAASDLVQFSHYRNALASGNFDAAAAVLQEQARQLSLLSGRRIDVNPLARFQDLDQRLQAGEIDEPTAMELARNRHMQGLQQQYQQRQQAQNDQYTQQAQAVRGGALKVDAMVSELMKDPDYAKVEPELVKQLDLIKTKYPPHMWAAEVKRAYDFEARLLRATAAAPRTTNLPTPLRGNGHSGGLPAPKTMEDAVLQSLGLS